MTQTERLSGYFQWLPLKPCSRRSLEWVSANALSWAAGMVFIFLGGSLPNEETHRALIVLSGAVGGIPGGLAMGPSPVSPPAPGPFARLKRM